MDTADNITNLIGGGNEDNYLGYQKLKYWMYWNHMKELNKNIFHRVQTIHCDLLAY